MFFRVCFVLKHCRLRTGALERNRKVIMEGQTKKREERESDKTERGEFRTGNESILGVYNIIKYIYSVHLHTYTSNFKHKAKKTLFSASNG